MLLTLAMSGVNYDDYEGKLLKLYIYSYLGDQAKHYTMMKA